MAKGFGFTDVLKAYNKVRQEQEREARKAERAAEQAAAKRARERRESDRRMAAAARDGRRAHAQTRAEEVEQRNQELNERVAYLESGILASALEADVLAVVEALEDDKTDAINLYFSRALDRSSYPSEFPTGRRVAYDAQSRLLVVEFELPPVDVVPAAKGWRYVKTQDRVDEVARSRTHTKAVYAQLLHQIALRTLHEVFSADRNSKVDSVVFNGVVDSIDKATGKQVRLCLLSVQATREVFNELELSYVEPAACLKGLGASLSRDPLGHAAVTPLVQLSEVDPG